MANPAHWYGREERSGYEDGPNPLWAVTVWCLCGEKFTATDRPVRALRAARSGLASHLERVEGTALNTPSKKEGSPTFQGKAAPKQFIPSPPEEERQ